MALRSGPVADKDLVACKLSESYMSKSTSADKGIEQGYRDPVVEAYKRDVDRTLLRENLSKTPEQRVVALMRLQLLARQAQ